MNEGPGAKPGLVGGREGLCLGLCGGRDLDRLLVLLAVQGVGDPPAGGQGKETEKDQSHGQHPVRGLADRDLRRLVSQTADQGPLVRGNGPPRGPGPRQSQACARPSASHADSQAATTRSSSPSLSSANIGNESSSRAHASDWGSSTGRERAGSPSKAAYL